MTDLDRAVEEARELLNRAVLETGTVVKFSTGEVFEFPALLTALEAALARRACAPLKRVIEDAINDLDPANNFGDLAQPMVMVRNYLHSALTQETIR